MIRDRKIGDPSETAMIPQPRARLGGFRGASRRFAERIAGLNLNQQLDRLKFLKLAYRSGGFGQSRSEKADTGREGERCRPSDDIFRFPLAWTRPIFF